MPGVKSLVALAGRVVGADGLASRLRSLSESEVKLAYSQGEWAAQIAKQLHDADDDEES